MKNRTLLLGGCGGKCSKTEKDRWKLLGLMLASYNRATDILISLGYSRNDAIREAERQLREAINKENAKNPPGGKLPGGQPGSNPDNELRKEFDRLGGEQGCS